MREIINNNWEFTSHWSDAFLHGAKGEEIVRIPHTVKEVPLHYADPDSYQMIAGYRKTLSFKDKDKNKRYFLIFEAAAHIATVWFNGKELGTHCNGYTSFRYEITGLVDFEKDNVVTVRLDTTENPSVPPFGFVIDYLTYGGIYRNVILEEREQNYIKDAFLKTPNLHTLDIDVQVEGKEETITVELLKDGKVLAEKEKKGENGTVSLIVDGAEPWSPEHPALYTCRLTYGKDVQEYTFGFRTIAVDENHFLLNGEPYFVRGLNRHQCFPYADITLDRFHMQQLVSDAMQELRLKHKKEAQKAQNDQRKQFKATRKKCLKVRKKDKKSKRGRKPFRKNMAFVPERLSNGDTVPELLGRCRYSLMVSGEKWTATQKERVKLVFERYPDLEEAYSIVHSLRMIFSNPRATWISGYESIQKWYEKVKAFGNDSFNTAADTIKDREDEVLNYFLNRATNASAESLNSKIKQFRAQLRGVIDVDFFLYRLSMIYG